jgi:RNA polymerase sigma factor (sigma-70 family)
MRVREGPLTEQEFAEHVEPHLTPMLRLARRLGRDEAEDIVQDALTRAWIQRDKFKPERGSFRSWLLAITADRAYKTWRWHLRHGKPILVQRAGGPAQDDMVDLERAIQRLPTRQRLAVNCFYFAGLSTEETAAVMKCSEGTVKSTLSAARSTLRERLR